MQVLYLFYFVSGTASAGCYRELKCNNLTTTTRDRNIDINLECRLYDNIEIAIVSDMQESSTDIQKNKQFIVAKNELIDQHSGFNYSANTLTILNATEDAAGTYKVKIRCKVGLYGSVTINLIVTIVKGSTVFINGFYQPNHCIMLCFYCIKMSILLCQKVVIILSQF